LVKARCEETAALEAVVVGADSVAEVPVAEFSVAVVEGVPIGVTTKELAAVEEVIGKLPTVGVPVFTLLPVTAVEEEPEIEEAPEAELEEVAPIAKSAVAA